MHYSSTNREVMLVSTSLDQVSRAQACSASQKALIWLPPLTFARGRHTPSAKWTTGQQRCAWHRNENKSRRPQRTQCKYDKIATLVETCSPRGRRRPLRAWCVIHVSMHHTRLVPTFDTYRAGPQHLVLARTCTFTNKSSMAFAKKKGI